MQIGDIRSPIGENVSHMLCSFQFHKFFASNCCTKIRYDSFSKLFLFYFFVVHMMLFEVSQHYEPLFCGIFKVIFSKD